MVAFLMTDDQQHVLSVLEQTGWLRVNQAARLLRLLNEDKSNRYALRVLKQLQYMQKVFWITGELITQPHLSAKPVDEEMLAAADIMLDLLDGRLLAISSRKPPFKLSFLAESRGDISSYGVAVVTPGSEPRLNFLLDASATSCTAIILLDDITQRRCIKTSLPHFFAVWDKGRYRYFKDAGG